MSINNFQIGDKVLITGEGSKKEWVLVMESVIGSEGIIIDIDEYFHTSICVAIKNINDYDWWWHPENLKKLEHNYIVPEELFEL